LTPRVGDLVVYQAIGCGHCLYCIMGQHSLCEQRKTFGIIGLEKKGNG
jgi:D-arabinose 1-dehydrogenase-like Zn-dependent alcohol dehydrogenase